MGFSLTWRDNLGTNASELFYRIVEDLQMKSTAQDEIQAKELIQRIEAEIERLVARGKKVHIIWDFDGVLASPLSDDVFALTGYDLSKYFQYEERLCFCVPKPGIWLPLAQKVGVLHTSQDIVTARSSFLDFRTKLFCMWHGRRNPSAWVRWILSLGHQAKSDSFRIILESFKDDPEAVVFFVDDNPKHSASFEQVAARLDVLWCSRSITSPVIRPYTREQLEWHYQHVMEVSGDNPVVVPGTPGGYIDSFLVLPNGTCGLADIMVRNYWQLDQDSAVKQFGPLLEITFKDLFPGEPVTPEGLYYAYHHLKAEAAHDTSMIKDIILERQLVDTEEKEK